jgi:glycoprotein endo-alpha-1,2-mannosidase
MLGVLFLIALSPLWGCQGEPAAGPVNESIHAFYYGWYANQETDGKLLHWNHEVLGVDNPARFPGGDDIGANFYPLLGNYSSNDGKTLRRHLEYCVEAGVGVLVVSWWGAGSFEDESMALLMDLAGEYGIGIAFHLEPIPDRGALISRDALVYLLDRYGDHPALHRPAHNGHRPYVYIYDSYLTPASEWGRLLKPEGDLSIRGTDYDIFAIGLWVQEDEGAFFTEGGFDGFYTYFASDGFTFGSSTKNWKELAAWARQNDLTFIPCVGPGYLDTRIRPWNSATTRPREEGAYFDRMFGAALEVNPRLIGITSFNEWHEGTQIEPSVSMSAGDYTYEDFAPLEPDFYLQRTRYWVEKFSGKK